MDRRAFLSALRKPAVVVAATPAFAMAAAHRGRERLDPHITALKGRMDTMTNRLDKMEASHKKTMKMLFGLTALSLGIDVSSLV